VRVLLARRRLARPSRPTGGGPPAGAGGLFVFSVLRSRGRRARPARPRGPVRAAGVPLGGPGLPDSGPARSGSPPLLRPSPFEPGDGPLELCFC